MTEEEAEELARNLKRGTIFLAVAFIIVLGVSIYKIIESWN